MHHVKSQQATRTSTHTYIHSEDVCVKIELFLKKTSRGAVFGVE